MFADSAVLQWIHTHHPAFFISYCISVLVFSLLSSPVLTNDSHMYVLVITRLECHMANIGTGRDIMPEDCRPEGIMSFPVPIFAMWHEGLGNN